MHRQDDIARYEEKLTDLSKEFDFGRLRLVTKIAFGLQRKFHRSHSLGECLEEARFITAGCLDARTLIPGGSHYSQWFPADRDGPAFGRLRTTLIHREEHERADLCQCRRCNS